MKIVIIGSGPTAMGAAFRIQELMDAHGPRKLSKDTEVIVLEKENRVGGLARSETDSMGFTWDLGVHVSGYSKYPKYTQLIHEVVPDWNNVPRSVKAFMKHVIGEPNVHDNYVPYPVQSSIPYFRPDIRDRCIDEMDKLQDLQQITYRNFGEFTALTMGKTLQKEFIRPYNEKVWTVKLEEMGTSWAENRVPKTDIKDLRRRSKLSKDELKAEEQQKARILFIYPKFLRGVGEMWQQMADCLPKKWFRFNSEVTRIDTENQMVHTVNSPPIEYDIIISTMPIVALGKITGLLPHIDLRHSTVLLVGIGMLKPQPDFTKTLSWIYFPLTDCVFYRCTFISNFNDVMTPDADKYWSVICEIGLEAGLGVDKQYYIDKTIKDLHLHGLINTPDCVVDRWCHLLPFGYPIPTITRDTVLAESHKVLQERQIYSRGRFGSWKYETANQDHSFIMGSQVVDKILFDLPEGL